MLAAGAPREYLSAAQPLVKLIGELTQRRDCSQVYIQKGSIDSASGKDYKPSSPGDRAIVSS